MQNPRQVVVEHLRRWLETGAVWFLALYLLVTLTPAVEWVVTAMDGDWYGGNGEVLVVLSGSMLVDGTGPNATLGADTYLRCVYAAWVLRQHTFHTVVVTGADGAAAAMARYLEQQGVPEQSILEEPRATSTFQNAVYTRELLLDHYRTTAPPPVVILTSDFHSWRARRVFQKVGLQTNIIAIPDALKQTHTPAKRWDVFLTLVNEGTKDLGYLVLGRL